jgi:hypothetical protein
MSYLAPSFSTRAAPPPPTPEAAPPLLEYRANIDSDVQFISKTVAGFAIGALVMGITLDPAEILLLRTEQSSLTQAPPGLATRLAFMAGIVAVSASLLVVGLKIRADHSPVPLFARHWLNSMGTGAWFAAMMYVPWVFINHRLPFNGYLAAPILMAIMCFPALAAKWTVGPQVDHPMEGAA